MTDHTAARHACRRAFFEHHPSPHIPTFEALLDFLAAKLKAPDFAEAVDLLHGAASPVHAALRQRERAAQSAPAA